MNRIGVWVFGAVALLLLTAFQSLVQQSVRQGEARRDETARQSEAMSVCNRLPGQGQRQQCRAGVG
jgi:hypothetical protein